MWFCSNTCVSIVLVQPEPLYVWQAEGAKEAAQAAAERLGRPCTELLLYSVLPSGKLLCTSRQYNAFESHPT